MSRAAGTAAVWLLACLPVALPTFYPPAVISLGTASILALAALPWIAWAGVPMRTSESWIGTLALGLPPIAAAFALDVGRGAAAGSTLTAALAFVAMIVLLGFAASRASAVRGPIGVYSIAWFVLVPGLPALRLALELGGAPAYGTAPGWLEVAASASPLAWAFHPAARPWLPIAVCALLLLVSGIRRAEEPA